MGSTSGWVSWCVWAPVLALIGEVIRENPDGGALPNRQRRNRLTDRESDSVVGRCHRHVRSEKTTGLSWISSELLSRGWYWRWGDRQGRGRTVIGNGQAMGLPRSPRVARERRRDSRRGPTSRAVGSGSAHCERRELAATNARHQQVMSHFPSPSQKEIRDNVGA